MEYKYHFLFTLTGCFAYHGHRVKMYDANPRVLDAFTSNLEADKKEIQAEGLMIQPNFLVSLTFNIKQKVENVNHYLKLLACCSLQPPPSSIVSQIDKPMMCLFVIRLFPGNVIHEQTRT